MTEQRRSTGARGERAACSYLARSGFSLIERNARTRFGELDIVALEGTTLVFIEVKTLRAGNRSGPLAGLDAIGPRKQRRVRRLARAWLGGQPGAGGPRYEEIRFDAVGVHVRADGRRARIEHIRAAF